MTAGHRTLIVTTKNEGPFLLEWVAYHRLIGFDNIVVFANDCEDGSDTLLTALDAAGLIRFYDNSAVTEGLPADPQNRAYRRAFAMDHVTGSDWVMVLDADEFLNIHAGDGTLDALFAATGPADVISGTWCIYGNSGLIDYDAGLVTERFTRCAPKDVQVSFRHFGMKTMFRPGPVHRLGIHRPFLKGEFKRPENPLVWLNGSGADVTPFFREKGWSASMVNKGYDLCQINHYMIKSNALFLMKRYRGTANSGDQDRINFDYYDSFNSNHTTDDSLTRWSDRIRAEIARMRDAHPAVAAAHDACTAFFHGKIASLMADLRDADPEVTDRLLNPTAVAAQIAADEAWLVTARAAAATRAARAAAVAARTTDRTTDPEPAPKTPGPAADAPAAPETPRIAPEDAAPQWLADLRRSDHRIGFYRSDVHFGAHFAERGLDQLVISFDNLSNVRDPSLARDSWGYDFYKAEGWSHLGVLSFAANWYRDDALFDYLEGLARSGFFDRFGHVTLTGTSMGAYAATAFARLIPGCTVLAFSPQSTLDTDIVPWEERFPSGRRQDWSGRYRNAAEDLDAAGPVFILYDPGCAPDLQHAMRYQGDNVVHLKTWFAHHKSALFLRRADILKALVRLAVAGALDSAAFYRLYRARRALPWYVNALVERACAGGHHTLAGRVSDAVERDGRTNLGRSIRNKIARDAAQ